MDDQALTERHSIVRIYESVERALGGGGKECRLAERWWVLVAKSWARGEVAANDEIITRSQAHTQCAVCSV